MEQVLSIIFMSYIAPCDITPARCYIVVLLKINDVIKTVKGATVI